MRVTDRLAIYNRVSINVGHIVSLNARPAACTSRDNKYVSCGWSPDQTHERCSSSQLQDLLYGHTNECKDSSLLSPSHRTLVPLWLYLSCSGTHGHPQCRSLTLSLSLSLIVQIAVGHIRLRARGRSERTRRLQFVNAQRAVRVGVKQLVENLDLCVCA